MKQVPIADFHGITPAPGKPCEKGIDPYGRQQRGVFAQAALLKSMFGERSSKLIRRISINASDPNRILPRRRPQEDPLGRPVFQVHPETRPRVGRINVRPQLRLHPPTLRQFVGGSNAKGLGMRSLRRASKCLRPPNFDFPIPSRRTGLDQAHSFPWEYYLVSIRMADTDSLLNSN